MKNDSRSTIVVLMALFLILMTPAGWTEDAEVRAERLEGLVESLNATSERRSRVLETIYQELRGPNAREMQGILREALSRSNSLIRQGVVEAMAMLGDPADVGALETVLVTTPSLEVKTLILRLLPAFCLGSSERFRFNYIQYAAGYQRTPSAAVLEPLRRPPLSRRGRLDEGLERMQIRVTRILVRQMDPVGAAMPYVGDMIFGQDARHTVMHYVGTSLGNDPLRWPGIWENQGEDTAFLVPDEVEELRLTALASLSDMAAEGLPEVRGAFGLLLDDDNVIVTQAVFETMAAMCRTAFEGYPAIAAMDFAAADAVEAETWRRRRFASLNSLAVFASVRAGEILSRAEDTGLFTAAAECMGAALNFPSDFPDPDGTLRQALESGLAELERLLLMPDLVWQKRASVAVALGRIGAESAVSALISILHSPYASPPLGQDGLRMAEAAVDALQRAAVGGGAGRSAARAALLDLLSDTREYPAARAGAPPVLLAHLVLWRLQRLARSTDAMFDADTWRQRLGW